MICPYKTKSSTFAKITKDETLLLDIVLSYETRLDNGFAPMQESYKVFGLQFTPLLLWSQSDYL